MKRGRFSGGYTIIETLIFLAVSGAMVVSVMILISGQQGRTEFIQTVRNFEAEVQDIANDVSTGYASYDFGSINVCYIDGSGVHFGAAVPAGSQRCVFIGRAIQFAPDGDTKKVAIYTLVGKQRDSSGQEVSSLATAGPLTLPTVETKSIGVDITTDRFKCNSCSPQDIGTVSFFTTFHQYNSGSLTSGNSNADVVAVRNTSLGQASAAARTAIATTANLSQINPASGVSVCLRSGGSNQHAIIRIGGTQGGSLTVHSTINAGACPAILP
jgi:type II secretory pathway pseudopilin PulG